MKIKNLKYGIGWGVLLSTSLTLMNYNSINTEKFKKLEKRIETLEEENQNLKANVDIIQLSDEISTCLNDSITFDATYNDRSNSIDINIDTSFSNLDNSETIISDDFYNEFNSLLSIGCPCHIKLEYLGNEIDFSRLDLSNVNEISFKWCDEKFNYDSFSSYSYDSIELVGVPLNSAKEIMCGVNNGTTDVYYHPIPYSLDDKEFSFVKFLVNNNISLNKFYVFSYSTNQELYDLLGCVNANNVSFNDYSDLSVLKFDLNLNGRIQDFTVSSEPLNLKELSNIEVTSNNPNLDFNLRLVQVTDNTTFSISDDISLSLYGKVTDVNSLYYLSNVKELSYRDYETKDSIDNDELSFEQFIDEIKKYNKTSYVKKK